IGETGFQSEVLRQAPFQLPQRLDRVLGGEGHPRLPLEFDWYRRMLWHAYDTGPSVGGASGDGSRPEWTGGRECPRGPSGPQDEARAGAAQAAYSGFPWGR